MRILFVSMSDSIHTARWIAQLTDQSWDLHLFPSIDIGLHHPDLRNVTVHHTFYQKPLHHDKSVHLKGIPIYYRELSFIGRNFIKTCFPKYYVSSLNRTIKRLKPDIVHSLEIQAAGYLTLSAKQEFAGNFPRWIVTNWGSDIYLFGRIRAHAEKIREVLSHCNYYSCECNRDIGLARKFGFMGKTFPVFPNSGGFDIEKISRFRQQGPSSDRRLIMLKGYQHWAGRALVGLRALERCADFLKGYQVCIYSASPETILAAQLFGNDTGIPVNIIPKNTAYEEILKLHGQARISIGLSISDAISTSMLEALVMGSFPIQSWTACADEWIEDGKTGFLVPPEDPEIIEASIRKALSDDELVNQGAEINYRLAKERLDEKNIKPMAIDIYKEIAHENNINL